MDTKKPLKVLHVVGAMNRAGTETMLMNIYRNLDHEKIQFDFISYSCQRAHYDREIEKRGGRVIRLSRTQSIMQLYKVIKNHGPYHAVHAHTLFHCGIAVIAAFLAGVKIRISHAHTTMDVSGSFIKKLYIDFMRRAIHLFSTHLLACSNEAGSYLFGEKGVTKAKYSYFPNIIDYWHFLRHPQTEIKRFKVEAGFGNNIVIGHIGRFMDAKNHLFLIKVMKNILDKEPACRLLLIGDGELREKVEAEARKQGIHEKIFFAGIREDIPTMLHSMDVFVFPSLYEGLGLVLLEAQASGVPCVVSEAIQPEADLNIGLVSKLPLAAGPEQWAEKIIGRIHLKEKDTHKIVRSFETRGYSLSQGIAKLMDIYRYEAGGLNEERIDRFL